MVMCLAPSRTPMGKGPYFTGEKSECYSLMKAFVGPSGNAQAKRQMGTKAQKNEGPSSSYITSLNKKSKLCDLKSLQEN